MESPAPKSVRVQDVLLALLPLLAASCLCVLFIILYRRLGVGSDGPTQGSPVCTIDWLKTEMSRADTTAWSIGWATAALSFCFAALWNIFTGIGAARKLWAGASRKIGLIAIVIAILVMLPLGFLLRHHSVGGAIVDVWISQIRYTSGVDVDFSEDVLNGIAVFTVGSIVLSLVYLASPLEELTPRALATRMQQFSVALYSGAALLACSLLEILMLFSWGAAVSPQIDVKKERLIALTLALSAAAIFSLLLIAMYVPVSILHHTWRDRLQDQAVEQNPDMDVAKWLQNHRLATDPWKSGAAVLSPLIAGVLVELAKHYLENH